MVYKLIFFTLLTIGYVLGDFKDVQLYNATDKVITLSSANLVLNTYNRNYAVIVHFYDSYCENCNRFVNVWKNFASDIKELSKYVIVAALDCALDENYKACLNYNIVSYPSIRYFAPHSKDPDYKIGREVHGKITVPNLREYVINQLNVVPNNPDLQVYSDIRYIPLPMLRATFTRKFIFVIGEPTNSSVAAAVILDLARKIQEYAKIYRIRDSSDMCTVQVLSNEGNVLNSNLVSNGTRDSIEFEIINYLNQHNISFVPPLIYNPVYNTANYRSEKLSYTLFYADILLTVQYTIVKFANQQWIYDYQIKALRSYLNVLNKYFPFGPKTQPAIQKLYNYLSNMDIDNPITGQDFSYILYKLQMKTNIMLSENSFSCYSEGLIAFPCGFWTLFHFLTVQASKDQFITDSFEILDAMDEYIQNMFDLFNYYGCLKKYRMMAKRPPFNGIYSTDLVILWLWEVHNEINYRLAGDTRVNYNYLKIQFPSYEACPECYNSNQSIINSEPPYIDWNTSNVLKFLKNIYAYENLNYYDIDMDELMINLNPVPIWHIVLGILLYICGLVIMIVVVKVLVARIKRKQIYVYNNLNHM